MMITESIVKQLVEEKIEGTEMFLVSAQVLPTNRIRVYVDAVDGLPVKACVNISRHIEGSLDREQEDFELEVSSPGLSEPFQHPLQYQKNVGRGIKVLTNDGDRAKGKLVKFENNTITVQPEPKKKKEQAEPITIPLSEIKEAKTVISFK
jgi:ribosome maturation factor RimP